MSHFAEDPWPFGLLLCGKNLIMGGEDIGDWAFGWSLILGGSDAVID